MPSPNLFGYYLQTFVLIHPTREGLITLAGARRVGTFSQVSNKKAGATVMINCEFSTSQILPSLIVMQAEWDGRLMQKWSAQNRFASHVLFNSTHWMTADAAKIYLLSLLKLFPGKTIGNISSILYFELIAL